LLSDSGPADTKRSDRPEAAPAGASTASEVASVAASAGAAPLTEAIPATLDAIQASWPELVAEVRGRSRFLGEALSHTTPAVLELPWLTVELGEPNPLFAERLQAQAQLVEAVLARVIGQPARLRVTEAGPSDGAPAPRPRKLTDASLKADRLRTFRSKDPTLDTAADALDLEIVD
jgi:hypothetical protein